jgi:hypothetical protein
VSVAPFPATTTETLGERVRGLQAQVKQLACANVKALCNAMADLQFAAAEIAEGGDAYGPGVRDIARRLVEDLDSRIHTLEAIQAKT